MYGDTWSKLPPSVGIADKNAESHNARIGVASPSDVRKNDMNGRTLSEDMAASTVGAVDKCESSKPIHEIPTPTLTKISCGYDAEAEINLSTFKIRLLKVIPNNQQTTR